MDFEQIKKLLEIGGGRCAIYKEGEPGYVILNADEFSKLAGNPSDKKEAAPGSDNPGFDRNEPIDEFQIEECALDDIKIDDLPL